MKLLENAGEARSDVSSAIRSTRAITAGRSLDSDPEIHLVPGDNAACVDVSPRILGNGSQAWGASNADNQAGTVPTSEPEALFVGPAGAGSWKPGFSPVNDFVLSRAARADIGEPLPRLGLKRYCLRIRAHQVVVPTRLTGGVFHMEHAHVLSVARATQG
jgi:hypothetical protein